tara:strand:- start:1143 stop:2021 length:879 start_codon:yes stop_codon:yes gene_type:complete
MSYAQITYTDKVENGGTTVDGLVGSANLNEIKTVVNANGSSADVRLDVVEGYVTTQESYAEISASGGISARVTAVDLPAGNVTVSLPSAASVAKQFFTVKRVANGGNVLTITSAELIDSVSNDIVLGIIHESITFYSDGVNYIITERNTSAYASISTLTPTVFASSTSPQKLTTWDTNVISTAGRITADEANNRVDVIYASGDAFDRWKISAELSMEFASNVIASFQIYYGGSPIGHPFSINGLGLSKPTTIPIQAIHSATGVGSIEIWVSTDSATNITFDNASMYVQSLSD